MSGENKAIGYIIPHTHWDREWRYPIWKNRMLLVEFMEQLLEILDRDPDYHCFLMDGQCVPVEDYLEVAPEMRERVLRHIREGRIAVGPWYTLPDLYPIDGECLVRNLLKGIRLSESYGGCLRVGYNSFGWGQTAQFPQIYQEFGFDFIICAKKVSEERAPESEFLWEAPDGTRVLTSRLGEFARANLFFHAYINARYGLTFLSDEFRYAPQKAGLSFRNAAAAAAAEDYFLIAPRKGYYPEYLKPGFEAAWKATDDTVLKSHRLFLNGCDFSTPQPDLSKLIRDANGLFADKEFVNCRLEEYAAKLKELVDPAALRIVKGELRDGPAGDCSANALASRIHIKQLNKKVQNVLLRKAEPFAAALGLRGCKYPLHFLNLAWKYALLSHCHDSINGVTQDKTAADVINRLEQALEIGNVIFDQSAAEIVKMIDLSKHDDNEPLLVVFNPLPYPVSGIVKVCVDTPREEAVWRFEVRDAAGNAVAVQEISRQEKVSPVHDLDGRPWPNYSDRHFCYLDCQSVPACGYRVYRVAPHKHFNRNHFYWLEARQSQGAEICKTDNVLENEYLRVLVNPNGTLRLTDKANGRSFENLHYFEDSGDVGNMWAYYPPYHNGTYNSQGSAAALWCEDNGPLSATLGVRVQLEVPAYGHEPERGIQGESKRSEEMTRLEIVSRITLQRNSRRVDVKTVIRNTAKNHRLRVAFPTGIQAEYSDAAGHFTVDRRPVAPVKDRDGNYWPEMQTLPMQHFVDVSDGTAGLALLNNSLTEYELKDDGCHTLYLTLFRSVGNMIVTGWESVGLFPEQMGSQLLQELEFEYAMYPHRGSWAEGSVYREAEEMNVPLAPYQVTPHRMGHLPEQFSFLAVEPANLILSAFKKAEDRDAFILRLFNPTDQPVAGRIQFPQNLKRAYVTNLNETRQTELIMKDPGCIEVTAAPRKIITLEIEA